MDFNTSLTQTIEDSFTQYAGAVIQSRALVDVRDCVSPLQGKSTGVYIPTSLLLINPLKRLSKP